MYIYEYDRDRNNIFYIAVETRVGVRMHFHNCMELIYWTARRSRTSTT